MISIKEYLEHTQTEPNEQAPSKPDEKAFTEPGAPAQIEPCGHDQQEPDLRLPATVDAYRSALMEMGNCGQYACPALGEELKQGLNKQGVKLAAELTCERVEEVKSGVREQLQGWGRSAASHYRQKTSEVKEILLVMARTAESVGERDQRCAEQITAVTTRLKGIANLEDLTEIRESIKKSATELKTSIDRMTAEGKAAVEKLRAEVTTYQTKLEEAENFASRDALTGVRSRPWVEGQIEQALQAGMPFCVAIIDLNGFKQINDEHGHMVGDEVLKLFAAKMRSVCRSTDTIGRWGGDEFILLLHCHMSEARTQIDRLREWVCCKYTVQGSSAPLKLRVEASIGIAERLSGEKMKELVDRADVEMYKEKAVARSKKDKPVN
jgi:diguanylate cyclase (GGDEF)-like protein